MTWGEFVENLRDHTEALKVLYEYKKLWRGRAED